PSDIMVLLRSPGSVLHHYLRAFEEEGIPWVSDGGEDFFATTEVNVALSILQIVDNPRQDVSLISALRSPVYGFSSDKLAFLRADASGDFYDALIQGREQGDEECRNFLEGLAELRFGAGDKTCRQLIWHIYEKTNLLGVFGAMDGGRERQDNLLSLYALAGQMEEAGCRSLFQFLRRLERLKEMNAKISSAGPGREGEGVSILSIHRSKGLEKPVVLVCGLTRRLNRDDLMRPVLFHPKLGIGPKGLDRERMVEYSTLARRAVARQLEREMMAEELRLLYVAMTRAKEKLILTLALTDGMRAVERLGEDLSLPVSPITLENQQNVGQWILLHALTHPEAAALRAAAGLPEVEGTAIGPAWDIRWVEGMSLTGNDVPKQGNFSHCPERETAGTEGLAEMLAWRYPYLACTNIPSKLTATQMKGRTLDQEAAEESALTLQLPGRSQPIYRPNFILEKHGLTPAQRGTALHQAMQYLPLQGDHSTESIRAKLKNLVAGGFLTKLQGEAIQPERLSAFLESPLGHAMTKAAECRREFKFSILVSAQDYFQEADEGEQVLLQGVIDAWFDDGAGVTIVDFKSDRIAPSGEPSRAEAYRPQLEAYSKALSAILGRPVCRTVLWFFATDTAWYLE
ncbi:MAG: 3'-5' exonuclease, partial [Lawsonibacter sp.]|nr:3'-5' exonuclease [Lawsonibacter sp.]